MANENRILQGFYANVHDWNNDPQTKKPQNQLISLEMENDSLPIIAKLHNGRAVGNHGSIVTENNYLLFDLSYEYFVTPDQHSLFKNGILPPLRAYPGTIAVLTFCFTDYYFHWLLDVLVRLRLLEKSGLHYDKILLNVQEGNNFQRETLELLGIESSRIITCNESFHFQVETLLVPSLVGCRYVPKWACDYLRSKLLHYVTKVPGYERIFISRKKARHRQLLNEDQVMHVLQKYGFKTVILEELPVIEQIKIFASAEAIISPHGGGLTNLIFSNTGTKVIELFSPNFLYECFLVIAKHMNLEYQFLIGEGNRSDDFRYSGADNIVVDIQKLEKALKRANINPS